MEENVPITKTKFFQPAHDEPVSYLLVLISDVEFAREFNYFISVETDPGLQRKRTDVSACVSQPVFQHNKFIFKLPKYMIESIEYVIFTAYIITNDFTEPQLGSKGKVRKLGECKCHLAAFRNQITDISENGVRMPLKLVRDAHTVGRFMANFKLVGDDILPPDYLQQDGHTLGDHDAWDKELLNSLIVKSQLHQEQAAEAQDKKEDIINRGNEAQSIQNKSNTNSVKEIADSQIVANDETLKPPTSKSKVLKQSQKNLASKSNLPQPTDSTTSLKNPNSAKNEAKSQQSIQKIPSMMNTQGLGVTKSGFNRKPDVAPSMKNMSVEDIPIEYPPQPKLIENLQKNFNTQKTWQIKVKLFYTLNMDILTSISPDNSFSIELAIVNNFNPNLKLMSQQANPMPCSTHIFINEEIVLESDQVDHREYSIQFLVNGAKTNSNLLKVSIPLHDFAPLHTLFTVLKFNVKPKQLQPMIYCSICVEESYKETQAIFIKDILVDPFKQEFSKFNRFAVLLCDRTVDFSKFEFFPIEVQRPGIPNPIRDIVSNYFASNAKQFVHITLLNPIVGGQNAENGIDLICLPKSYFDRELKVGILIENDSKVDYFPNLLLFSSEAFCLNNFPLPKKFGYCSKENNFPIKLIRNAETQTPFLNSVSAFLNESTFALDTYILRNPQNGRQEWEAIREEALAKKEFEENKRQFEEEELRQLFKHSQGAPQQQNDENQQTQNVADSQLEDMKVEDDYQRKMAYSVKDIDQSTRNVFTMATVQQPIDINDKWRIMSNELAQKQALINRFLREYEEKLDTLKTTSSEITELKKQQKLLDAENKFLKKKMNLEEKLEIQELVEQDIEGLNERELRLKLVKTAQIYREERKRNQEFEKALQSTSEDLLKVKKLKEEFDSLTVEHLKKNKELTDIQTEISKYTLYKETISKQEKIISRLEKELENCIIKNSNGTKILNNLDEVEKENAELRKRLDGHFQGMTQNGDIERLRNDVMRLTGIRDTLKNDLQRKRPISKHKVEKDARRMELETKLQSLQNKVGTLERMLAATAQTYTDNYLKRKPEYRNEFDFN